MIPNEPRVTPELVAEHGLTPDEYERFRNMIGREPSYTELGIVSAMWNEHCSYKSSKVHLRTLPTQAPWVIQGPGENAGVIDIGGGLAVVFKMKATITLVHRALSGSATVSVEFCATSSPWAHARSRA
jgi:phosphoribosylformylglycinamidine synthase